MPGPEAPPAPASTIRRLKRWSAALLKAPVHLYRWTLRPWLGWPCRHLPTCSDYALEAIDINGAWRGGWLTLARLLRCQPFGTSGFDPVPDIHLERHPLAPWRYGLWTGAAVRRNAEQVMARRAHGHGEPPRSCPDCEAGS